MRTIADRWAHFQKSVLPPNTDKLMHEAMKVAFYAGALGTLDLMGMARTRGYKGIVKELKAEIEAQASAQISAAAKRCREAIDGATPHLE